MRQSRSFERRWSFGNAAGVAPVLLAASLCACSSSDAPSAGGPAVIPPSAGNLSTSTVGKAQRTDVAIAGPLATLPQALKRQDFRLTPPRVDKVFASRAADGGTNLEVNFVADPRLDAVNELTLRPDPSNPITLTRSQGYVYTGHVLIPFSQVLASQKSLYAIAARSAPPPGNVASMPVFRGHEQVGRVQIDLPINEGRIRLVPHWFSFILPSKSLTITSTNVVEDPGRTYNPCAHTGTRMGPWTFGKLITDMAGTNDPAVLTKGWLDSLNANQTVNGLSVPAVAAHNVTQVLNAWPKLPSGQLDIAEAPVKLLAIVNRIDLAGNPSYGPVSGAEGRFVFEFVNCPNASPDESGSPRPFLFIIEYGVPIDTCPGMRSWAQQWEALSSLSITNPSVDPTFNDHLQTLTDQFATANLVPSKPNGSALNQLRVNLLAMNILDGWSLREFHLEADGFLHHATVAQTPDSNYNHDFDPTGPLPPKLAIWINANPAPYTVPLTLPFAPAGPFLGGESRNDGSRIWWAPGIASNHDRHVFSQNTCMGCHGRETGTVFTHIKENIPFGTETTLSGFLTGKTVIDPKDPSTTHVFNELLARNFALQDFANATCLPHIGPIDPLAKQFVFPDPLPPIEFEPVLTSE